VEFYSTNDINEARILRNALEDEGIRCKIDGEHQAGFTGMDGIAIRLMVLEADVERARAFVEEHQRRG
jgi:hypothetical protein